MAQKLYQRLPDPLGSWEDERELVRTAKAVADDAGLGYRELPGDPNFIQALLEGGKDGRFLRIAPASRRISTVTEPLQPCG